MAKYKGFLLMNDGHKNGTLSLNSPEEVQRQLREQLKFTTRYYKRNGVDFGQGGKLFTYEEEHGGVKQAIIYKVITEPLKDVTELLK